MLYGASLLYFDKKVVSTMESVPEEPQAAATETDDATVRQQLEELMLKFRQAGQREQDLRGAANRMRSATEEIIKQTLAPAIAAAAAEQEAHKQAMYALAEPRDRFMRLTKKHTKTIQLENGEISRWLLPASLVFKATAATVIERMRKLRLLRKYTRREWVVAINTDSFKRDLQAKPKLAKQFPGVELVQEEKFYFRAGKTKADITVSIPVTTPTPPKED